MSNEQHNADILKLMKDLAGFNSRLPEILDMLKALNIKTNEISQKQDGLGNQFTMLQVNLSSGSRSTKKNSPATAAAAIAASEKAPISVGDGSAASASAGATGATAAEPAAAKKQFNNNKAMLIALIPQKNAQIFNTIGDTYMNNFADKFKEKIPQFDIKSSDASVFKEFASFVWDQLNADKKKYKSITDGLTVIRNSMSAGAPAASAVAVPVAAPTSVADAAKMALASDE